MSPHRSGKQPPQVVVSHPARQGFVYNLPLAAQEAGLSWRFLTGLYAKPGQWPWSWACRHPKAARMLAKRSDPRLDPDRVIGVSGPLPELLSRVTSGFEAGNDLHDRLAARWIRRRLPAGAVFHGAIESCLHSLRAARARGATTLLEITLPPWKEEILAAEAARLGEPARAAAPPARLIAEIAEADRLMVQSPFVADFLAGHGIARERMVLLPLGADLQRFRPPVRPRPADGPLRVLYVGHINLRKGVHLLLETWRRAALSDAELLLVGPVVDDFGRRLLAELPPGARHLGVLEPDRLAETMRECDLFVFLSLIEGGPLVVLEALASGLPCLLSTPARSVVRDGQEGRLVPPVDVEAGAAALRALAADRAGLARMGEAAARRGRAFGWDGFRGRLGAFYRSLLLSGPARQDGLLDLTAGIDDPGDGPAAAATPPQTSRR